MGSTEKSREGWNRVERKMNGGGGGGGGGRVRYEGSVCDRVRDHTSARYKKLQFQRNSDFQFNSL